MRHYLAAALGVFACVASAAERDVRHFLAVSATSYNPTAAEPPGQILLYDRDSARQIAHFDYAGQANAPATTPDGTGLYVVVSGPQPGIAIIDLRTLASRSFLPTQSSGFVLA